MPVRGEMLHGPFRIAVASDRPEDFDEIARVLRPAVVPLPERDDVSGSMNDDAMRLTVKPSAHANSFVGELDGRSLPGETIPGITRGLLSRLDEMLLVEERQWPHLHAALIVVQGHGVLIPAKSGSGKSNLAAALCRGNVLVTDELVTVDRLAGELRAVPRPICVKPASQSRIAILAPDEPRPDDDDVWLVPAAALGAMQGSASPPGLVIVPSRDESREGRAVHIDSLSGAEVLEVLIAESFDVDIDPPGRLEALAWLSAQGAGWRVRYGHAVDAVAVIDDLVASWSNARPAPKDWFMVEELKEPPNFLHRHPSVLSVVIDDEAILWRPDTKAVLRLDGAGAAVWEFLDGTRPVPEFVQDFVDDLYAQGMVAGAR